MTKIISSIVALMLSAVMVSVAVAAHGDKGYYYGAKNPEHLAQLIDESFAKDASGKTKLSAEKCHKDGSCATPQYYFEAINKALVEAGFKKRLKDVSEVPGYIRTLKVLHSPYGKYEVSCLRPLGNEKFQVIMDCLEREFETDEEAWVDSEIQGEYKIDLVMITSKCANVVYRKIALKITIIGGTLACVEIHFTTKPGDSVVRFALLGPADVKDDCFAVKRAGSTVYERWWVDKCPDEHCGFRAAVEVVGQSVRIKGSYALTPGEHVLRLPAFVAEKDSRYVTALCLDRGQTAWPEMLQGQYTRQREQWIAGHSDGIGIRWFEYLKTATETKVATIWYTQAEGPKNAPYWPPSGEYARLHQQQAR